MTVLKNRRHIDKSTKHDRDGAKVKYPPIADSTGCLSADRFTRVWANAIFSEVNHDIFGASPHNGEFRPGSCISYSTPVAVQRDPVTYLGGA